MKQETLLASLKSSGFSLQRPLLSRPSIDNCRPPCQIVRMKRMSLRQFGRIVARVMETLPEELRQHMPNVVVDVEREPDEEMLRGSGYSEEEIKEGVTVFGLFAPLGSTPELLPEDEDDPHVEFPFDYLDQPHRLIIYKGPHEREFTARREFLNEVRKTVVHEVAHHFGYSEKDLERFEANPTPFPDDLDWGDEVATSIAGGSDLRPKRMPSKKFDRLVARVVESLPEELKAYLEYVVIDVEDQPDPFVIRRGQMSDEEKADMDNFYGLVFPMPMMPGSQNMNMVFAPENPFRVVIYQKPLERDFGASRKQLRSEIRETIIELMVRQLISVNNSLAKFLHSENPRDPSEKQE